MSSTTTQRTKPQRAPRPLPGFALSLATTVGWLALLVLLPLFGLLHKSAQLSWPELRTIVLDPRVLAAFRLSFTTAFIAAMINGLFGLVVAWVLVRYRFVGRRILDALVDLPFALPTAVAGIALTAVYAESGPIGGMLARVGIKAAFTPLGITLALVFIGLPFVVRTLQPVIEDLDPDVEEAAAILGASRWQIFVRIIVPELFPALLTGTTLAFARGLGEYGSVVFIAGNMPMKTEIVPLVILTKLEQYDYAGATAVASLMLILSVTLLFTINALERWRRRRSSAFA